MTPMIRQTQAALFWPPAAMVELASNWTSLWASQSARILREMANQGADAAEAAADATAETIDRASDATVALTGQAQDVALDMQSRTLTATGEIASPDDVAAEAARDVTDLVRAATGATPSDPIAAGRYARTGKPGAAAS